jgi:pentatricopeptide repeat protein
MYNCVLDACVCHNDMNNAISLMKELSENTKIIADVVTYNTMVKGCAKTKNLNLAKHYYY